MMNNLLVQSNNIRKETGYCTIIEFGEIKIVTDTDKVVPYVEGKSYKVKKDSIQEESKKKVQRLETIEPLIRTIMDLPEEQTTEEDNIKLIDRLSRLLLLQGAYYEQKFYVNGKVFENKHDLVGALPYIYSDINNIGFEDLFRKVMNYDVLEKENLLLVDGLALIAPNQYACGKIDLSKHVGIACVGYIEGDKVKWDRVFESEYVKARTTEGEIKVLRYLYDFGILSVLRYPNKLEKSKVQEAIYPVAILEDGEYAHYFEK